MKKYKGLVIICLCSMLTACSSNPDKESIAEMRTEKETGDGEEMASIGANQESGSVTEKETDEYIPGPEDEIAGAPYSMEHSIKYKTNEDGSKYFEHKVCSGDVAFNAGMMIFINGIPQSFTDETGKTQYLSCVDIGSNGVKTVKYTCDFNNVLEADSYVCSAGTMLMSDVFICKRKNFTMGHIQSLTGWNLDEYSNWDKKALEINKSADIDIVNMEFEEVENDAYKSQTLVSHLINGEATRTVYEKEEIKNCTVELFPQMEGEYVISFWGNGQPVQVGEHMYYKVRCEARQRYAYTFELDKEQVNEIDNFFIVACPTTDGIDDLTKTSTNIFVDKYE